ncbi:MAG: PfkB family carbohydrate kinase [Candidatus Nanoarchaeia archaeon]|nr:PfkB family carbohydrate kinase [Candidatus Nanoarchaeia archaeon]
MLDILSIGNANADIYSNGKIFPGGSANNFAVACAKLGLKSGFLGIIGNDEKGTFLINNLKKNKVKSFIRISDKNTGTVKILSKGFNKKFIKSLGANEELKNLNLEPYLKLTKNIHLATPPIELLKQLPVGLNISVDPGKELSNYSITQLKPYLKNIKIFFATEDEAKKITGKDYDLAANELINLGVKIVAIKRNSAGIYVKTLKEEFSKDYIDSKIIDATGGGDAFASAFISALILKKSVKEAANWGLISSSIKLEKLGAQNTPSLIKLKNQVLKL